MIVPFGGHDFFLHHAGVAIIPAKKMAIVSDMHLEKASHFAQRGFFLPPYDSQATLQRLHDVLAAEDVTRLLILGDCFHDGTGYGRLTDEAHDLFDGLRRFDPLWITGNHDGDFVPPGFQAHDAYAEDGLIFRHQAMKNAHNEISGHFHPKIRIVHKGAKISKPCFATDGRKLLMPAFGAYTGGMFVEQPQLRELFHGMPCCYMLGQEKVFRIAADSWVRQ